MGAKKTMKWKTLLPVLLVSLWATSSAQAMNWNAFFCLDRCWPDCIKKVCCDDYCPKPMPCVKRVCKFGCDDYCPKPEPCVKKTRATRCDDYRPKCPPVIKCPPCGHLKCAPAACARGKQTGRAAR